MARASDLLRQARALYDAPSSVLPAHASQASRGGFLSGAEWMRLALGILRDGQAPVGLAAFHWLGFIKYALALGVSLLPIALLSLLPQPSLIHGVLGLLALLTFYAVEVQWVFLFPVALDGSRHPWRDSWALMHQCSGTLPAMAIVMPLAWEMLSGGWRGRGFVRSWSLGCLAVALWYERARADASWTETEEHTPLLELLPLGPLMLRREAVKLAKPQPGPKPSRLLFLSDLHLRGGTAARILRSVEDIVQATSPEVIILGGDYADTESGFVAFETWVSSCALHRPVVAIAGNHDRLIANVRERLLAAGAHWLPDAPYCLRAGDLEHVIFQSNASSPTPPIASPASIITVLHDPSELTPDILEHSAVILAGHLHGCQAVAFRYGEKLYPGAWFYRWNGQRFNLGSATFLVSRGIADTLPLRWNCPREALLCTLEGP
jgi:predicted MPP superfamily phosphohydrolase